MEWLRVNTADVTAPAAIELAEPSVETQFLEYDEGVAYTESLLDAYVQGELTQIKPITDGKEEEGVGPYRLGGIESTDNPVKAQRGNKRKRSKD